MNRTLLVAVAAALSLAGCQEANKPVAPVKKEEPAPQLTLQQADPQAYHESVGGAMSEIPTDLRPRFQQIFICEMKKNNKSPNPKPVTAEYIRELTAYIKANPDAVDTCAA